MIHLTDLILVNLYVVSILKFSSGTKLRNNTEKAPFGIPGASTTTENNLRVKPIVEIEIGLSSKLTGTLVTQLIRYCNQSSLA